MNAETGVSYRVERIQDSRSFLEPDLVLLAVLKGSIQVLTEDDRYTLRRGGLILINPGISCELRSTEDTLIGKCVWSIAALSQVLKGKLAYFYCNSAVSYSRWHKELRSELESMTGVYAAGDHQTDSLLIGYLYRILDCLIEHFQMKNTTPGISDTKDVSDASMAQIMQYILINLHGEISLTSLAEQMYISASTLSRFFTRHTGLHFSDFVQHLRIKEAMTLLENGVSQSFAETLAIIAEQTTKVKENPLAGLEGMPIMHALARKVPIGLLLEIMGENEPQQFKWSTVQIVEPGSAVVETEDDFGMMVPDEWLERDSRMTAPVPGEDVDPDFSIPTDNGITEDVTVVQIPDDKMENGQENTELEAVD